MKWIFPIFLTIFSLKWCYSLNFPSQLQLTIFIILPNKHNSTSSVDDTRVETCLRIEYNISYFEVQSIKIYDVQKHHETFLSKYIFSEEKKVFQ